MDNPIDKITDSELEILKILWVNESPMTEKQIRDTLKGRSDWKRTTIQTLVKRLVDKGIILKDKKNIFHYVPAVTASELAKARTEELLAKVFGGNAKNLVSSMLNNDILSKDDLDDLKNFWQDRRNDK